MLRRLSQLLLAAASLLLFSGCVVVPPAPADLGEYENRLDLFLQSDRDLVEGSPTGASEFRADSSAVGGVNAGLAYQTNGAVQVYEFKMKKALSKTLYLNLSKSVQGILYWSSATQQAGGSAPNNPEATHLRVQLLVNGVLAGGDSVSFGLLAKPGQWQPMGFSFRPEIAVIPQGATLTLQVLRFTGTTDFLIGTGGTHTSYVEFHYFGSDPLAGALYLERGVLLTAPSGDSPDGLLGRVTEYAASHDLSPMAPGPHGVPAAEDATNPAAPLALGLLALGTLRPRGRTGLLALMVLAVAFGGCLGAESGGPAGTAGSTGNGPTPTVSSTLEVRPDLVGRGAIEGTVRDTLNFTLRGVHVSLLGTTLFTKTDAKGRFAFPNVTEGSYTIRFDTDGFVPLEQGIEVENGKVTKLDVRLVKPQDKAAFSRPHVHDDWGEKTSLELLNGPFTLAGASEPINGQSHCATSLYRCERTLGLPKGAVVPPGTTRIEIVLDWSGGNAPRQLGLSVTTSGNATESFYVPRGPKTPFNVVFFPNEADTGHQTFSLWKFKVYVHEESTLYEYLGQQAVSVFTQGNIRIVAHKGVVPYEPAHRDFWEGRTEIQLFKNAPLSTGLICCGGYPQEGYSWTMKKGLFVPPGTLEIRGTFTWSGPAGAGATANPWRLAYRTANVAPAEWEANLKHAQGTASGGKLDFTIKVGGNEADQFYQSASNWQFYPDDQESTNDPADVLHDYVWGPAAWSTAWTLTATVYRDPAWADEPPPM